MKRFQMIVLMGVIVSVPLSSIAEEKELSPKEKDREAILAMAGTYVVNFHFQETVPFELGYQLKGPQDSAALEVIVVDEETENKIVLQHLLQSESGRVTKHWRDDWEYENRILWEFQGENVWTKRELSPEEATGTWTQRVFQVDDSPRYESYGKWIHTGNLSQWQSQPTNRPLPRREHTTRSDYNILVGINRHALTQTGWVHEQDNYKLRRDGSGDHVLVRELGWNRYDHTQEGRCSKARQWWRDNRPFWMDVRTKWDTVFRDNTRIAVQDAIEDGPLYEHLFALGDEASKEKQYSSNTFSPKVSEWINRFLAPKEMETQVGQSN